MARARSSDQPPAFDFHQTEAALRLWPEVEILGLLPGSSNHTLLARVAGGEGEPFLAVYKPARGERPLWDFPGGTLYRREVAAYLLARRLGWPSIPPTVVRRDAPLGVGALQQYIQADLDQHYLNFEDCPEDLSLEVAVFDVLTNNADRKAGHFLRDNQGRIWLIDHGLTFHTDPKLRTVVWEFAERALPERLLPDLRRIGRELAAGRGLARQLTPLLSEAETEALRARLDRMLDARWRLPSPSSGWSIPWPPI